MCEGRFSFNNYGVCHTLTLGRINYLIICMYRWYTTVNLTVYHWSNAVNLTGYRWSTTVNLTVCCWSTAVNLTVYHWSTAVNLTGYRRSQHSVLTAKPGGHRVAHGELQRVKVGHAGPGPLGTRDFSWGPKQTKRAGEG